MEHEVWGEAGRAANLIADVEAKGGIISIGTDGQRWIVNYIEDPDDA